VAEGHSDPLPLVGRDLSSLVRGTYHRPPNDPIYFMTDDDPSRGLNQDNFYGVGYDSVIQPNHIESVIVEINGEIWKYSRYFDNEQFWSDPEPLLGPTKDVVLTVDDTPIDVPGEHPVPAVKRVKLIPEIEEFEMYNVSKDPMELRNLISSPAHTGMQTRLASLLEQQRAEKRLQPVSGDVPGQ
jgi:choline-sulfatase